MNSVLLGSTSPTLFPSQGTNATSRLASRSLISLSDQSSSAASIGLDGSTEAFGPSSDVSSRPTTSTNGGSAQVSITTLLPSSPAISQGFYLRGSSASGVGDSTYGYLSYGGTLRRRKRSDFYVVKFKPTVAGASVFYLDADRHLTSGDYVAALPGGVENRTMEFLPRNSAA